LVGTESAVDLAFGVAPAGLELLGQEIEHDPALRSDRRDRDQTAVPQERPPDPLLGRGRRTPILGSLRPGDGASRGQEIRLTEAVMVGTAVPRTLGFDQPDGRQPRQLSNDGTARQASGGDQVDDRGGSQDEPGDHAEAMGLRQRAHDPRGALAFLRHRTLPLREPTDHPRSK
jgi:hypothetical protein